MTIRARTGLEPPQILLEWAYGRTLPELTDVVIRRSKYRFPEDASEGAEVLDEALDYSNLRTSLADTDLEPDLPYYYSLFFRHYAPFAQELRLSQDIERLGSPLATTFRGALLTETLGSGDGVTTAFSGSLSRVPARVRSVRLLATSSGVDLEVADDGEGSLVGDVGVGENTVDYETGEISVDFASAPDDTTNITVEYTYDDETRWVLAADDKNQFSLWSWSTKKELAEQEIKLSDLLEAGERFATLLEARYLDAATLDLEFLTNLRYLRLHVPVSAARASASEVISEWALAERLSSSYVVVGGCREYSAGGVFEGIRIADAHNKELKLFDDEGTLLRTMSLSGLGVLGEEVQGCSFDAANSRVVFGHSKYAFGIDTEVTAPTNQDVVGLYPVRQPITADFSVERSSLLLVDKDLSILEDYVLEDLVAEHQQEEPMLPTVGVRGLWPLDVANGAVYDDISGEGNFAAALGLPTQGADGKFDEGLEFESTSTALDLSSAAGLIDPEEGFVGFWWTRPYEGYLPPSASRSLFVWSVDEDNSCRLTLEADGSLLLAYSRGGTSNTVSVADGQSHLDSSILHRILVQWTVSDISLYVDGELLGSTALAGAFSGTPSSFYIGDADGSSALGIYDDVVLGDDGSRTIRTRTKLVAGPHRVSAYSGRDPNSDGVFNFRDKLFSYFPSVVQRNDYEKEPRSAEQALESGEVVFRHQNRTELTLGHLSALCRLIGLEMDAIVDARRYFNDHLTASRADYESLPDLGQLIYADDIDEEWNVDKRRRYLETRWFCNQMGGTLEAFQRMARFLGFTLYGDPTIVVSRRRLDSCVDPDRPDTPFDSGRFDSRDNRYPLARIKWRVFRRNATGTCSTSTAETRELTDAAAQFLSTVEVGSLVVIEDYENSGDNGQYLVKSVDSDTQLTLDRDFPEGSLSGLDYSVHWRVPNPDPHIDALFQRLKDIKTRWQRLERDPQ